MSEREGERREESLGERLARLLRARPAPESAGAPPPRRAFPLGPRRIEDLLPGEEVAVARGACWLGRWEFDERALEAGDVAEGLVRAAATIAARAAGAASVNDVGAARTAPRDGDLARGAHAPLLFLDLETTGFSGTPLFLAGLVEVEVGAAAGSTAPAESAGPAAPRSPRIEQLLARDYSEEAAVIEAIAARLARRPTLVTFNGKSYDLPFLRDRAARHLIPLPEPREHVDLLHAARRRFRGILPDCRLATLEAHMSGAPRVGDVPGWEIPARYHDAVRRGDPSGLAGVFLHNALDLVTLGRLFVMLHGEVPALGP